MDISGWVTLAVAVLFRLLECYKKVGKLDILAILQEFMKVG